MLKMANIARFARDISFSQTNQCGCILQILRKNASFSRNPVRVYQPKRKELTARQSLLKVPVKPTTDNNDSARIREQLQSSGETFRTLMGNIHTSKSKHLIALEGGKLVEDAIKFGLRLNSLFLLKSLKVYPDSIRKIIEEDLTAGLSQQSLKPEIHRISLKSLEEWSSVKTPPGIIGVFEKPRESLLTRLTLLKNLSNNIPLTLVLDNVRDPGNLGSILRTAAGIGCRKVILSEGCVDPWDMKTLRSGNGAQFFVPMLTNASLEDFHQYMELKDLMMDESHTDPNSVTQESCDSTTSSLIQSGIGVFLADSGTEQDSFGIPIVPHTSINYSQFKSVFLVMGGETTGLSFNTRKTIVELEKIYPEAVKHISRVNIPMSTPIDSLNVANAFGIIGYEILRQCMGLKCGTIVK